MTGLQAVASTLPFRVLLDEAVRQSRRHFKRIYPGVAVPIALVGGLLSFTQIGFFSDVSRPSPDPAVLLPRLGGFALVMFLWLVVYSLGYGTLLAAAVDAAGGREIEMRRRWLFVLRPRVLGTLIVMAFAVSVGFVFCLLPGLYVGLLFSLCLPVMAEEGLTGLGALRRSVQLVRYNPGKTLDGDPRFKVFVVFFVGALLGYTANFLVQLPLVVMQQILMFREISGGQRPDPAAVMARMAWVQVPAQILGMLVGTAVHLYVCFGLALLFFDVKRRKEGVDLETAIAQLVEAHLGKPPQAEGR